MSQCCTVCAADFDVQDDEIAFLGKMKFLYGDTSFVLPEPRECPDCRQAIRTAHRNEQFLYKRRSDKSGKEIVSLYPEDAPWGKPYIVYSSDEWHSDSWDALSYARDYDFSRSFFEQFKDLQKVVPRMALQTLGNENSPFSTGTGYCKNCHLINSSENCQDCYYGKLLQGCKNCVDCSYLYDSELCYECFSVYKSYNCHYLSYGRNCSDCWFSENLYGCSNCFLCTNLSKQSYCFFNKQLSKEEYLTKTKAYLGSYEKFQKSLAQLSELCVNRIHKYANISSSENCTGDFIENSKHCLNCYDVTDSQDCRYVAVGVNIKDVHDCSNMYLRPELNYQVLGTIETYHCAFCLYVFHSQDILYSDQIFHSKNLFGCVGLNKAEHCILNRQYSKEDYNTLVPKIIKQMQIAGEWGEFFPVKFAPHAYNESLANDYYPQSKEVVLALGWNWRENEDTTADERGSYAIADNIKNVPDEICKELLRCEKSFEAYKIIPQELNFYRKHQLPIPRRSPRERHRNRMALRNPRRLWKRVCDHCNVVAQSPYSPKRPEKIYCDACYLEIMF